MTTTLRAQLPLGPKGSPPSGRTTAGCTGTAELRAERRAERPVQLRPALHHIQGEQFALDLLGWSGALESRLVSFEEWRHGSR